MADAKTPQHPVLVIDDNESALEYYQVLLDTNGINNYVLCEDPRDVLQLVEETNPSTITLDLVMPDISGKELLEILHEWHPEIPITMITGTMEVETAVECMKIGAFDYLLKPIEENRFVSSLKHAMEIAELRREVDILSKHVLSRELEHPEAFAEIITDNSSMKSIFSYIEAIAPTAKPVLITGESGTGKELFAAVIHRLSNRDGEFVPVNAAGLDDTLFQDTLFGHRKGAYTGADSNRSGLIEQAAGGTLFLDEIGDLSSNSQVKLLRLLQEHEYYSLGSDEKRTSDARVIAATNVDLASKISDKKFRNDLFYRLNTHHIQVPALRKRLNDIPLLVNRFIAEASESIGKRAPTVPRELYTLLQTYHYPGNIRELESMIFDMVSRHESKVLSLTFLKDYISSHSSSETPASAVDNTQKAITYSGAFPTLKEVEDFFFTEALRKADGNQSIAAQLLGVSQSTLSRRLKNQ